MLAFKRHRTLIVALLYGEESDWLRNMSNGGGRVVRGGRTYALSAPRVLDASAAAERSALWPLPRAYCQLADKQAIFELGERLPGFGPRGGS